MSLTPGTLLNDRYRIVSTLGQGGMGSVYRAEDEILGISVAVKENLFLSEEYARQFQREAKILASLRHPNLPRVGDYCAIQGQGQYLIMDYIEGEDLRQRIERLGTIPEEDVILIGVAICDALSYLHSRRPSVVHRDLKPGNIKITPEGEIVLVDFGLAKLMLDSQVTTTGARAMTPGYSPPEQYGTARTDQRTDIYSLGATLYAALTGIIPEDGLARATGKARLTPIRQIQPRVRRSLATAIEKSLEVEPEKRFQTADEFKKALLEAGTISPNTHQRLFISPPPAPVLEKSDQIAATVKEAHPNNHSLQPSAQRPARPPLVSDYAKKVGGALLIIVLLAGGYYAYATYGLNGSFFPPFSPETSEATLTQSLPAAAPETTLTTVPGGPTSSQTNTPPIRSTATYPLASANASPMPVDAEGAEIAFASDRTGVMQIWLMDSTGNEQRQLTNMPAGACQPSWSPDGENVAFISPCEGKSLYHEKAMIYIVNVDGTNLQPLPVTQLGDFDPAWSPDGQRIAFTSLRTGREHIFVYNLEDQSMAELSDTRYPDMHPAWHPSGKQLAFVRQVHFNHIWVMTDKGQTEFQFSTSGNVNDLWPVWSPDGMFILFSRTQISPEIPWLLKLDYEDRGIGPEIRIPSLGSNIPDPGPIAEVSISPDGKSVIFESWPDGNNHDIYSMDLDGNNLLRLTSDPGFDFDPSWRPVQP